MAISLAQRTEQLRAEQQLLKKADTDIEDGWQRIHAQEVRVREFQTSGHDAQQAERLVDLLKETLVQWERHRTLIIQRVDFLQHEVDSAIPANN